MASPDVIGHGQAEHGVHIGLEQFRSFARSLHTAFPDMEVKIDFTVERDDLVVARWTATMTHTGKFIGIAPTGEKVTITGTTIQKIANGKIVEGWDNWDQLGLLVQLKAINAASFLPGEERAA
jgi:predicted ester cyclase